MPANADLTRSFLTFRNFPEVIGSLIRAEPSLAKVGFAVGRPKSESATPHIYCRRVRRVPGMDRVETRSARLRDSWQREDGTVTELYSQWMTCVFQFDICAHSGLEAEELATRFESLLKAARGQLFELGLSELRFEEELEDHLLERTKDIEVRSLRYLVRFDDVDVRTLPAIESIKLRVLLPFEEDYEAVVRGADLDTADLLSRPYIAELLQVSNASASGFARDDDYLLGIDFIILHDFINHRSALQWLKPGKRPAAGATYYVRYRYWSVFNPAYVSRFV